MKDHDKSKPPIKDNDSKSKTDPKGYPLYPDEDDIYAKFKEEPEIDPDTLTKKRPMDPDFVTDDDEPGELEGDQFGDDLDVPGSDLDDDQEDVGNEDEENNYYSIGGDNHNDLEEDNTDE